MSIILKEIQSAPTTMPQLHATQGLTREEVNSLVSSAMASALDQGQKQAQEMLAKMRAEIAAVSKPKHIVMAVEVDQIVRPLTKPASPNLGRMIINAKMGLNTLLVGPAGSGKTVAAEQLSEAMGLSFGHLCLTAGASETWLFGRQTANGFIEGSFSEKYRNGGVFLGDEMDAADANLLLAINTALANGHLYNPIIGENISRHKDFVFVGAANTLGRGGSTIYTGRSRLDAATLNRFVVLPVDYCTEIEAQVCPDDELRTALQDARKKLAELKSSEIISTRSLDQAYRQVKAGVAKTDIFASMTMGWPEGLARQCGLTGEETQLVPSKPKKEPKPASTEAYPF